MFDTPLQKAERQIANLAQARRTYTPAKEAEVRAFAHYNHASPGDFSPEPEKLFAAGLTPESAGPLLQGERRLGDLLLTKVGQGDHYSNIKALCCCGEEFQFSRDTLVRRSVLPPPLFYRPVDHMAGSYDLQDLKDPVAENPTDLRAAIKGKVGYPLVCPHIEDGLRQAYPHAHQVWARMRSNINTQVLRKKAVEFPLYWFRRDIGFFLFLQDIGEPAHRSFKLTRSNVRGVYHQDQFFWLDPQAAGKRFSRAIDPASDDLPEVVRLHHRRLAQRYYSLADRARREQVPIGWTDAEHFLRNLPDLPHDFHPDNYRLTFDGWKQYGFGPGNSVWQRVASKRGRVVAKPVADQMSEALGSRDPGDGLLRQIALAKVMEAFLEAQDRLVYPANPGQNPFSPGDPPCIGQSLLKTVRHTEVGFDEQGKLKVVFPPGFLGKGENE